MRHPLIAITVKRVPAGRKATDSDTAPSYRAEIERAGGVPILLAPDADLRGSLDLADGLLLPGGGDVDPREFNAKRHRKTKEIVPARDRMEIEAIRLARARGMPILAICRGIQVLNVALGGDLIQDIPSQIQTDVCHQSPDGRHFIEIEPKSLLARLMRGTRINVNSRHHQAVGERLATGLRVTARSADGVVEAVEAVGGEPVLGVQFHPENLVAKNPRFGAIFTWLVTQTRRYRRSRPF